ncbi:MAG: sensor histidine kinase [Acidimicrobiia bacterium]
MPGSESVIERWRRLPPLVADAALAGVVAVVTIVAVVVEDQQEPSLSMSAWGWFLLALQLVPLIWRRRFPLAVLLTCWLAAMLYGMAPLPDPPLMFGPLLATYTMAAYCSRRMSVPVLVLLIGGSAVAILGGDPSDAADVVVGYFSGITAWVVGDTMRTQRERAAWMATRRVEEAQHAASQERLAIARDLHDVVAHNVSVIAVQAEAAQAVLGSDPARAERAMEDVAETARSALAELRRLMGVLRSEVELAPQPGLEAIDDLVENVRRAGMDVELSRTGGGAVEAIAGLTAYRVVQEALTNVLKHAGPCATNVGVDVGTDALVVTVIDDGRGPRNGMNGGHGLVGMRERVAVLGGTLDAGAGVAGGFVVRARLPRPA